MNFVLFHMGNELPDHFKYCVRQIKYTNPNSNIHIITNLNVSDDSVQIINTKDLSVPDIGDYFMGDTYELLWRTSILRLFYIQDFLSKSNIEDIIHFDNDIVLYKNLDEYKDRFSKFNFLITPRRETEYVFGFSYIKNANSLFNLNEHLLYLVRRGNKELEKMLGSFPHEMRLLNFINQKNNMKFIDHLPVVPSGPGSDNFDLFEICFDPATYGMHVGGSHMLGPHNPYYVPTPDWHGTEKHHYAGEQIASNKIKVIFEGKIPKIIYNNNVYEICNLHIHTKKLEDFIT